MGNAKTTFLTFTSFQNPFRESTAGGGETGKSFAIPASVTGCSVDEEH
jgi:hypothetical protein